MSQIIIRFVHCLWRFVTDTTDWRSGLRIKHLCGRGLILDRSFQVCNTVQPIWKPLEKYDKWKCMMSLYSVENRVRTRFSGHLHIVFSGIHVLNAKTGSSVRFNRHIDSDLRAGFTQQTSSLQIFNRNAQKCHNKIQHLLAVNRVSPFAIARRFKSVTSEILFTSLIEFTGPK
jgi:hypothetical protein